MQGGLPQFGKSTFLKKLPDLYFFSTVKNRAGQVKPFTVVGDKTSEIALVCVGKILLKFYLGVEPPEFRQYILPALVFFNQSSQLFADPFSRPA